MSGSMKIKATLKEIRHLSVDPSARLEDVKRDIQHRFPVLAGQECNVELCYHDSDGDEVPISTENEWREISGRIADRDDPLKLNIRATPYENVHSSVLSESEKRNKGTPNRAADILRTIRPISSSSQNSVSAGVISPTAFMENSLLHYPSSTPHQATYLSSIPHQASDDFGHVTSTSSLPEHNHNHLSDIGPSSDQPEGLQQHQPHDQPEVTRQTNGNSASASDSDEDTPWPPPCRQRDTLAKVKLKQSRPRYITPPEAYPNNNIGRVIIFNNQNFRDPSHPDIKGDFDTTCLSLLFKQEMKFELRSYTNLSTEKMKEKMDNELMKLKRNYSCCIVVILTHWVKNSRSVQLHGCRNDTMELAEITNRLRGEEKLQGIPKLVFIDGVKYDNSEHCHTGQKNIYNRMSPHVPGISQGEDRVNSCPVERMDDFYVYMANTLGQANPTYEGSMMLQALVKVFCENIHQDHFRELMRKTEDLMQNASIRTDSFQMPQVYHDSLSKDLYFMSNSLH